MVLFFISKFLSKILMELPEVEDEDDTGEGVLAVVSEVTGAVDADGFDISQFANPFFRTIALTFPLSIIIDFTSYPDFNNKLIRLNTRSKDLKAARVSPSNFPTPVTDICSKLNDRFGKSLKNPSL